MIAYFVHNQDTQTDAIIIPEMSCAIPVDRERLEAFISPAPVFSEWSGEACASVSPEDFGTVAASRDEVGDVSVLDDELWRKRMEYHMSTAS